LVGGLNECILFFRIFGMFYIFGLICSLEMFGND
jgi:hypothetical protein